MMRVNAGAAFADLAGLVQVLEPVAPEYLWIDDSFHSGRLQVGQRSTCSGSTRSRSRS